MTGFLYSGIVRRRIVPYKRTTKRGKWRDPVTVYHKSQKDLAAELMMTISPDSAMTIAALSRLGKLKQVFKEPLIDTPYRLGVALGVPPLKRKVDVLPRNRGDYDNYVKAVLDAMQYFNITSGDTVQEYRGPCPVKFGEHELESGVYPAASWMLVWTLRKAGPTVTLS